jgi:hypothetical protein
MIFPENLLPVISPGNHMIEYTSKMDSRASGRGKKITSNPLKPILNYLTPFSFLIRIPTVNPVALQRLPHGHDVFGWSLGLDGLGGGEYESGSRCERAIRIRSLESIDSTSKIQFYRSGQAAGKVPPFLSNSS